MTLSNPIKLTIGAVTLLPFVYMIYFFVSVASVVGTKPGAPDDFELLFRFTTVRLNERAEG